MKGGETLFNLHALERLLQEDSDRFPSNLYFAIQILKFQ